MSLGAAAVAVVLLLPMMWMTVSGMQQYFNCPNPLPPLVVKGKRFFNADTGAYFPIQGIAYYPRPNDGELIYSNSVDFFTDQYESLWTADIENFVKLGVNVIRIYAVDPSQSHDAFMCALQAVGIYVMVDLLADCENCAIGITTPPDCYPIELKNRGQFIINVFSKYTNTITFSAGNEVTIFADDIADNAPCQKSFSVTCAITFTNAGRLFPPLRSYPATFR
jgi:1,3-beta-glucanosyltransferase GAS5